MDTIEYDGVTFLIPREAADVSEEMLTLAEETYDAWFSNDERIDWEDFIDKLCTDAKYSTTPFEFDEYINGAVSKIQRHVREYRNM